MLSFLDAHFAEGRNARTVTEHGTPMVGNTRIKYGDTKQLLCWLPLYAKYIVRENQELDTRVATA